MNDGPPQPQRPRRSRQRGVSVKSGTRTTASSYTAALLWLSSLGHTGATTTTTTSTATTNEDNVGSPYYCIHDQSGNEKDTGCSSDRPFCIGRDGQEPLTGEEGERCVPCLAKTDHPGHPDLGCNNEEPICVVSTTDSHNAWSRPDDATAGDKCIPWPSHNTKDSRQVSVVIHIDDGCTLEAPDCVDGLGQDPPIGAPGMHCISRYQYDNHHLSHKMVWGKYRDSKDEPQQPTFLTRKHQHDDLSSSAPIVRRVSLCTGCPLSGQSRSCEATKACDSLGGAIMNW